MLNTFIFVTITIAILGLITLTITSTQKRIKEFGIRKVNGASVFQILVMLNRDFIKWVIRGFLIICPVAWYFITWWLDNFAIKTEVDAWIFIASGVLLLISAINTITSQSAWAPIRNPVRSLRHE